MFWLFIRKKRKKKSYHISKNTEFLLFYLKRKLVSSTIKPPMKKGDYFLGWVNCIPDVIWYSKSYWDMLVYWLMFWSNFTIAISYSSLSKDGGLPWWVSSKESACNARAAGDTGPIPGLGRFPWRRVWKLTPVFLPGESPETEEPGGLQSMEFSGQSTGVGSRSLLQETFPAQG